MGDWTPVPWRRVDRKQMLYPLDHDAPHCIIYLFFIIIFSIPFSITFNQSFMKVKKSANFDSQQNNIDGMKGKKNFNTFLEGYSLDQIRWPNEYEHDRKIDNDEH